MSCAQLDNAQGQEQAATSVVDAAATAAVMVDKDPMPAMDHDQDDHGDLVQSPTTPTALSYPFPPTIVRSPPPTSENVLVDSFSIGSTLTSSFSSYASGASDVSGGIGGTTLNSNLTASTPTHSTTSSRRSSVHSSRPIEVKETLDGSLVETKDGLLQVMEYVLLKTIGRGAYGTVHLGVSVKDGSRYAIKEFSKSKLRKKDRASLYRLGPRGRRLGRRGPEAAPEAESDPLELIRGEIAVLKKLNHNNIVKLFEVVDVRGEDSMYMVFELCERGVLTSVSLGEKAGPIFSDADCRYVFHQMILGIEYLHEHEIIHRDIKPDNLLRSADGTLKIVDFGVSEIFKGHNDLTKKSAGSPAFMAPEFCRPDHGEVSGKPADVWSMGVTLYCIRYGRLPFVSTILYELSRIIREEDFDISTETDEQFAHLMRRLLDKDPNTRITIDELRNDPWVTNNGKELLISKEENIENAVTEVTDEDLRKAFSRIGPLATVVKAVTKFKSLIKSSSRSSSRDNRDRVASEESIVDSSSSADQINKRDSLSPGDAYALGTPAAAPGSPATTTTTTTTTTTVSAEAPVQNPSSTAATTVEATILPSAEGQKPASTLASATLVDSNPTAAVIEAVPTETQTAAGLKDLLINIDQLHMGDDGREVSNGGPHDDVVLVTSPQRYYYNRQQSFGLFGAALQQQQQEKQEEVQASSEILNGQNGDHSSTAAIEVQTDSDATSKTTATTTTTTTTATTTTTTTTTAATTSTTTSTDDSEHTAETGHESGSEPAGYQVCDFDTGLCYWVPAKPATQASSEPK